MIAYIIVLFLVLILAYSIISCKDGKMYTTLHGIFGGGAASDNFVPGQLNKTRSITLYHTTWCGYCKRLMPTWNQLKMNLVTTGIKFIEVDGDDAKKSGRASDVTSYPTLHKLDENGVRSSYTGVRDYKSLRDWIVSP